MLITQPILVHKMILKINKKIWSNSQVIFINKLSFKIKKMFSFETKNLFTFLYFKDVIDYQ